MAKKINTDNLPGVEGEGVSPLSIPALDKLVAKYEKKKEAAAEAAPDAIVAKEELLAGLHEHATKLPVNEDGYRFYRCDDVDYVLKETLGRKKVPQGFDTGSDE